MLGLFPLEVFSYSSQHYLEKKERGVGVGASDPESWVHLPYLDHFRCADSWR